MPFSYEINPDESSRARRRSSRDDQRIEFKALGANIGSLARGAATFDPNAEDGDGDGIVQDGTPFERPAIMSNIADVTRRGLASAGATGVFTNGKSDLVGLTNRQVAERVVPDNPADFLERRLRYMMRGELSTSPSLEGVTFNPEDVERIRELVEKTLEERPALRASWDRFGCPPIAVHEIDDSEFAGKFVGDAILLDKGEILNRQDDELWTVSDSELGSDDRFPFIKGLNTVKVGEEPEDTLVHEWGHYLHRLTVESHPDKDVRDAAALLYDQEWPRKEYAWTSEERTKLGLGEFWKYRLKLTDNWNTPQDRPDDSIPFVDSLYGASSPVEFIAEAFNAYFSPDKSKRAKLNDAGVELVETFLGIRGANSPTSGRQTSTGGSMRGMSASEMARIIVPSNKAEALALLNDHQQLLALNDDDTVRLDAIDDIVEGGFDSIDFSPEVVEELRQAITGTIANNRLFRDAVERHGMPPVLATKRGAQWDDGDMTFAISAMDGFPAILVNQDVRQRFLQGEFGNGTFDDVGKLEGTEQFLISNREDAMFVHEWGHYINRLAATSHPDPEIKRLASFWFSETWDHDAGLTGIYKVLDKLGVPVGEDKFANRVIQAKKFGKKVADGKSEKWNGFPHVMSQYGQMMPAEAFAEGVTAIFVDDYNLRGKVSPALREDIFDIIGKPYSYERDIAGGIDESRAGLASLSIPRDAAGDRLVPSLFSPEAERTPLIGRDYLKDATNEEIADIIAPRSVEDAFNLSLMNLVYGQDPSIVDPVQKAVLRRIFMQQVLNVGSKPIIQNGQQVGGGEHFIDFTPSGVARVRDIIKRALDASPAFAWQVRTFGCPPVYCTNPDLVDQARQTELITGVPILSYEARHSGIAGWSTGPFGICINTASDAIQANYPIGQNRAATAYETRGNRISPIFVPGSQEFMLNVDTSPEGTLYHEWAHGFWSRVTGWTSIANQLGTRAGDRGDRLSYLYPGNPEATAIGRFVKDTFDASGFIPYSSADGADKIIQEAYRQVFRTLGQKQAGDFLKLIQSYNASLTDRKTGRSRWRPSISEDLLDEIAAIYPFLVSDMAPLLRVDYGTSSRQEQYAELNTLFVTPDTLQQSKFLIPELDHMMAYTLGLKPTADLAPYVKPWLIRDESSSIQSRRQRAIGTVISRVSIHSDPFVTAQRAGSARDIISRRDGLITGTVGGYTFLMRDSSPSMDIVFDSWSDPVENWRMRQISSEVMGLASVSRSDTNGSYGSDANYYLLSGEVSKADAASKEEIQQSTLKTISAMKDIIEGGYASDAPLYRAIRNVDTDSEFFEPQVGSVISMPLTSFSPDEKAVFGYTKIDDTVQLNEALSSATSLDKKKVVVKLREGVAVSNSPITRPTTDRDGRVVDMPIESLTAGEFMVKNVTTQNGVDVVELEQVRVFHPTLGSNYDGSDRLIRNNKRNAELTGKMTESLSSIKEARQRLDEAATYSDKNRALDDMAFEKNRYSSITRQLRSEGDAVDKFDIPSRIGGLASMSPIEDRAKRHGVSLDAFNDESLDADDIEWSTNEWSFGKTNRVMAGDVVVVRTRNDGKQEILTIERKSGPFRGALSLPGGLQDEGEDLYDTAEREMFEEVNISPTDATGRRILGQVDVKDWDPRFVEGGRIAGIRFDITDEQSSVVKAGDDANKFKWVDVEEMSRGDYPIAFGHASWLAESFADDPVLGPRFAVLAEASRVRNQRLIKKIDAKRKEAGVKEFGEMPDPTQPYKTTTEGIRTGLASASSFDRNINPTPALTVDFWKAFQEGKDYFVTNPVRDDVYNQTIDVPWIENLFETAKRKKLTHAELVGAYKAFTELVENRLNNDVDPGTAFERRTALKKLRNMVVNDDEHFVKRYTVGGRYTYAAYRGNDYLGDYRTEEEANQAIRNSMSERARVGLASASIPTRRSDSGIPEQARTKLKAKIDTKQEEIDALEDLNNRLRAAKQEFEETGNWEGQKYNIRLTEDGGAPVTYTKEELEAELKEGESFDDYKKKILNQIDSVGYGRKKKIDQAKNEKNALKQKLDFLAREQNENSFSIDELLADEELADELRRRDAQVKAMPMLERDARYTDDEGYIYVLHWGASTLQGGALDPARSRGQVGGGIAGNTRQINDETARGMVAKRDSAKRDISILEDIKRQAEKNNGVIDFNEIARTDPSDTLRAGRARLLLGIDRRDGDIQTAPVNEYRINQINSQIDSQQRIIDRLDKVADQLIADDYQYSSTYRASMLQDLFSSYGGRYAEEGSTEWGNDGKKSPFTGIHVFRVKVGDDATEENSVGETHLVGKHTPIASLIADNDPESKNPASNTWAGWVDMVIEQDKKNRSAGLASSGLTQQQSRVVNNIQDQVSDIVSRSSGLASRSTPTNPIGKNTEEIAKEIELSPDEMKILEDLIPNADKIKNISVNPALKDSADELLDSVRVTVGDDGIPFIYASPHPLLSEEIPDKRNWSAVIRPRKETLEKVKNLIDSLVKKSMGEDTPEEFWARSTGDGDKVKITEAFREEATKLKTSFGQWAKDLLDNVVSSKQEIPSNREFRLFDKQGQPTWLGMWADSLRDLASPNVQTFFGDNELTSHDVWGHLGTGRGFDRHGEWANMLAMFSLMDRWAEEKDVSKEELLKLKALWFQTFEFGRVDGEFKPPAEQIRAEDKWYIKQWAIDSAFDYADTAELEELISLIDDGNTHTGVSKGLASTSGSELAEIAKNDIVRQSIKKNRETNGLASSSQLTPTDDIEEAKRTGRPLSILRPGTMPPRTQAAYDEILRIRREKLNEALELKARYQSAWDKNPTPPYSDEEKDAIEAKNKIRNELLFPFSDYAPFNSAFEEEFRELGFGEDDIETMRRGIVMHLTDMMPLSSGKYNQQGLSDEARLQHSVEALDKADIAIAFPKDLLEKLIADGRFKTQFETKSSRGALHPEGRREGDAAQLGYHPNTSPEMRPVYGYLTSGGNIDRNKLGSIKQYGELQFVLKRDIHSRSTYTTHDSLSSGLTPSPMGVPSKDASGKAGETMYAEAQIHGGISLSDVDYVVINVGEPDQWDWQNNKVSEKEFQSISGMLEQVGIRVVPVRDGEIVDTWNGGNVIPEPKVEPVGQPQEPVKVVA